MQTTWNEVNTRKIEKLVAGLMRYLDNGEEDKALASACGLLAYFSGYGRDDAKQELESVQAVYGLGLVDSLIRLLHPEDIEYLRTLSGTTHCALVQQIACHSIADLDSTGNYSEQLPIETQWWMDCLETIGRAIHLETGLECCAVAVVACLLDSQYPGRKNLQSKGLGEHMARKTVIALDTILLSLNDCMALDWIEHTRQSESYEKPELWADLRLGGELVFARVR